jgi:hypothetical protein
MEQTLGWSTDLALFPVRHHSPTCARHLEAWLEEYRPDAILIEGPAGYNDRIQVLADPEHEAPFALVAAAKRGGEVLGRAYYPFCDYSPELVALRVGKTLGAELRFIDLAYGERERGILDEDQAEAAEEAAAEAEAEAEAEADAEAEAAGPEGRLGAAEDGPLARSRFTKALIQQSGCRDFDEVWEALFEQTGWDAAPAEWALGVAAYAELSRAGYSEEELRADATLVREEAMAWHIAEAQKSLRRIAVVTGAFHTVALRGTKPKKPKKPKALAVEVFLAPYTLPRLDALLGYASGMSGPAFYQKVWEDREGRDPFGAAALSVLVEAARLARSDGEVLGTADAITALAFARSLADFRGRPRVGRVELIEAAKTCFVKGDAELIGRRVTNALAEIMRGSRVGKLGPSAGQSPLVLDFHRRLSELRLPLEHGRPKPEELAIFQSELALARSRFFQVSTFLELGFAEKQRGPDLKAGLDLHLTIEHWTVQYVPEIDARLVELSHLGATVEDVAAALLLQKCVAAEGHSGALALLVLDGLVMGLHRPTERMIARLAAAMFEDDDALSLLAAGSRLRTVLRGRERLEAARVGGLSALARQAYVQGTLRLERLAQVNPDQIDQVLEALAALLDVALTEASLGPSRELLKEHAHAARDAARQRSPAILGAFDGFLLQLGDGRIEDLARQLTSLGAGRTRSDGLGAYLEGILAVARQALGGDSALLKALLEHIAGSDWEDFVASLPSLRRAMTRLTPRETEAIAETAAAVLGVSKAEAGDLLAAPPAVVSQLGAFEQQYAEAERRWAGGER